LRLVETARIHVVLFVGSLDPTLRRWALLDRVLETIDSGSK